MKPKHLAKKVVVSNGAARHIMYVNAEDNKEAANYAIANNYLLSHLRRGGWHISYIL